MNEFRFVVPGLAVGKKTPLPNGVKAPATREYEELVKQSAMRQFAELENVAGFPFDGYIYVVTDIFLPMPKFFTKQQIEDAEKRIILPIVKPDNSNTLKSIEDGVNKFIITDDRFIVGNIVFKYYDKNPRVEVKMINCNPSKRERPSARDLIPDYI